MSSRPLFIKVALSMVIFAPMFQLGCLRATALVLPRSSSVFMPKKGPPEAVKLFLEDKIGFLDIGRLVEAVVDSDSFGGDYSLADVYECDRMARAFVRAHL